MVESRNEGSRSLIVSFLELFSRDGAHEQGLQDQAH